MAIGITYLLDALFFILFGVGGVLAVLAGRGDKRAALLAGLGFGCQLVAFALQMAEGMLGPVLFPSLGTGGMLGLFAVVSIVATVLQIAGFALLVVALLRGLRAGVVPRPAFGQRQGQVRP